MLSCYNVLEVIDVTARLDQLMREIEKLSLKEARLLYGALAMKLTVPLQDPESFYDDWNDTEVDAAYAETR